MGIWTDWMRRARKKQEEAKPKQGNLVERLLQGQFFLMVLPVRGIELEEKYQCRSVERKKIPSFWKNWRDDQGLMLEVEGVGTCLFSTLVDELPAKLQSRFRAYRCYVFGANDTYGYFKILEQGRIVRKIASDGQIRFQGRFIRCWGSPAPMSGSGEPAGKWTTGPSGGRIRWWDSAAGRYWTCWTTMWGSGI